MKITPQNYKAAWSAISEIEKPGMLFVSLFHLCSENIQDFRNHMNIEENRETVWAMEDRYAELFGPYGEFKNPFRKEGKRLMSHGHMKLFIIAMLKKLDRVLAGEDGGCSEIGGKRGRAKHPEYYTSCDIPVFFGAKEYILTPQPENFILSSISEEEKLRRNEQDYQNTPYGWVEFHRIVPVKIRGLEIKISPIGIEGKKTFVDDLIALKKGALKIGAVSQDKDYKFEVDSFPPAGRKEPHKFLFRKIKKSKKNFPNSQILTILNKCLETGVDILVFPELTVDGDLLSSIINWLNTKNEGYGLKVVVAGSFHLQKENGRVENRCTVLDYQGAILWKHAKLVPFSIKKGEVTPDMARTFEIPSDCAQSEENIECARYVEFRDFPHLGRVATPICLDYLNPAFKEISSLVGGTLFFVPTMSPSFNEFKSVGRDHYAKFLHASTFIAAGQWIQEAFGKAPHKMETSICILPCANNASKNITTHDENNPDNWKLRVYSIKRH